GPRTVITFPGGAPGHQSLPFVVGVLADLSGTPEKAPRRLRDARFIYIDPGNFDEVLRRTAPRLELRMDTWPNEGGAGPAVVLTFRRLADFSPAAIAEQVPALKALLAQRQHAGTDKGDAVSLDNELSTRLSKIMHHPEFQRLEAAWRGLHYLVSQVPS